MSRVLVDSRHAYTLVQANGCKANFGDKQTTAFSSGVVIGADTVIENNHDAQMAQIKMLGNQFKAEGIVYNGRKTTMKQRREEAIKFVTEQLAQKKANDTNVFAVDHSLVQRTKRQRQPPRDSPTAR